LVWKDEAGLAMALDAIAMAARTMDEKCMMMVVDLELKIVWNELQVSGALHIWGNGLSLCSSGAGQRLVLCILRLNSERLISSMTKLRSDRTHSASHSADNTQVCG
jgi:hypothetical protein